jgi:hypothetical protein
MVLFTNKDVAHNKISVTTGVPYKNIHDLLYLPEPRKGLVLSESEELGCYPFVSMIMEAMPKIWKMLLLEEWGIWRSIENMPLYEILKRGVSNSKAPLIEEPAHHFGEHQDNECAAFLQVALLLMWGGVLYVDSKHWFVFSHDGWSVLATTHSLDIVKSFCDARNIKYEPLEEKMSE